MYSSMKRNPRSRFLVELEREKICNSWRENKRNKRKEKRNGREMRGEGGKERERLGCRIG